MRNGETVGKRRGARHCPARATVDGLVLVAHRREKVLAVHIRPCEGRRERVMGRSSGWVFACRGYFSTESNVALQASAATCRCSSDESGERETQQLAGMHKRDP